MRAYFLPGLLLMTAATAVGCRASNKPAAEPAQGTTISPEKLASVRETYQKINPSARIGQVIFVRTEGSLAAVGDVDLKEFHPGDQITIIDAEMNPIVYGQVIDVGEFVDVKYDAPRADRRGPQIGDLAVRVK